MLILLNHETIHEIMTAYGADLKAALKMQEQSHRFIKHWHITTHSDTIKTMTVVKKGLLK